MLALLTPGDLLVAAIACAFAAASLAPLVTAAARRPLAHGGWRLARWQLLLAASLAGGCGGGASSRTPAVSSGLPSYVAQVQSGGVTAALRAGRPTAGDGPAVALDAGAEAVTIPGGSRQITVTAPAPFTSMALSVSGVDGYYEISGFPATQSAVLVVTVSQHAPAAFTLAVAAGGTTGFGTAQETPVSLTSVGTGDVQINVSWDVDSDVDLHVVDPSGEEIYYGNRTSSSGGTLDLDSNAACSLDHKRSENITWPTGGAPHGTYTVRVDYWSSCHVSATNYVVTANVAGQPARVERGQLTGDGDTGGQGSGSTVFTVTF